jgi:hypothetical protein
MEKIKMTGIEIYGNQEKHKYHAFRPQKRNSTSYTCTRGKI